MRSAAALSRLSVVHRHLPLQASSFKTSISSSSTNSTLSMLDGLESILNARDFASATEKIAPHRLLRSGNPANGSLKDVLLLRRDVGVRQMLDFRSSEEHAEDAGWSLMLSNGVIKTYDVNGDLTEVFIDHHEDLEAVPLPPCELHRLSLLERNRFIVALIWRLPFLKVGQALIYRLLGWHDEMRNVLVPEINRGGLVLVYGILLDTAAADIHRALEIITSAAESRLPLLLFCKLGKDRTGVISALVLACCGATEDEIIADYARSDGVNKVALGGLEKMRDTQGMDQTLFASAPPEAMKKTLDYIRHRWGGLHGYLDSIGFREEERRRLAIALSPETPW